VTIPNDEKVMSEHNIRLTASEMGFLWTQYENDYFGDLCFKIL